MIPGSNQELMIFKIQSLNSSITFHPPPLEIFRVGKEPKNRRILLKIG